METKQKLISLLTERLDKEIAPQNPVKFLKKLNVEDCVDIAVTTVYLYTRMNKRKREKTALMSEVIAGIGHPIRQFAKLPRDSGAAAKAGAFILYSFEQLGIIKLSLIKGKRGHGAYGIEVIDDDKLSLLWEQVSLNKTEKLPSLVPYKDWTSTVHDTGVYLIKTMCRSVLDAVKPETHPIIFEVLNRAQKVGWMINQDIYPIFTWALRNKTEAFSDIWELADKEAKTSKIREAKAIGSMAKKFHDTIFYHLYYYDFRGRKYPATAYLHEQGSDLARGLLLRADKKPIGKSGYFWLLVGIASNWAGTSGRDDGAKTDKIPLKERMQWSLDNEEILLSYVESPKVNQGWMNADNPWQFLAGCFELAKLRHWQQTSSGTAGPFAYESHMEVYIDGTNNGSQHLAALTKDDVTAPHVNLVPLELPGDLYKYVADHVWEYIDQEVSKLTQSQKDKCEKLIDDIIDIKKQIPDAEPKSERRQHLIETILRLKTNNEEIYDLSPPVFWKRITDSKHRRKIVKRNVMTLPYGGTPYGLGNQQIDDARKHDIPLLMNMEHRWAAYMGRAVYEVCKVSLRKPMQLLKIFELAGKKSEERLKELQDKGIQGEGYLGWIIPITNFPVVQYYVEGIIKKLYIQYGPPTGPRNSSGYYENTLQLAISFLEEVQYSKRKQSQGASPNAIHSLDAAHLMLTVYKAPFVVSTIHDSYGCLLGDMEELYKLTRSTFVELYQEDPLSIIMQYIGGDISQVEFGNLDINLITESEYCFS